ncbi:MAG: hypothetical protein WCD31_08805 [Gillisia sp.]
MIKPDYIGEGMPIMDDISQPIPVPVPHTVSGSVTVSNVKPSSNQVKQLVVALLNGDLIEQVRNGKKYSLAEVRNLADNYGRTLEEEVAAFVNEGKIKIFPVGDSKIPPKEYSNVVETHQNLVDKKSSIPVSGGISFGNQSTKDLWLPIVGIAAVVAVLIFGSIKLQSK